MAFEETPGVRRISDKIESLALSGYLIPFITDVQPQVVYVGDSEEHVFIMVFSTESKLKSFCSEKEIEFSSIKQITDGKDFFMELPRDVRVMVDPYVHENGRIRFMEAGRWTN